MGNHLVKYDLLDFESAHLIPSSQELFKQYDGISITSPYKKHFLAQVSMDEETCRLQAINCLAQINGSICGFNTDFLAVQVILKKLLEKYRMHKVFILGNGSMSFITQLALEKEGVRFHVLSRTNGDKLDQFDFTGEQEDCFIINSCSREFVFKGLITQKSLFWDYNYHYEPHQYLQQKCTYIDGYSLLQKQAEEALSLWRLNKLVENN